MEPDGTVALFERSVEELKLLKLLNRIKEIQKLCLRPHWSFFIITWSKRIMNIVRKTKIVGAVFTETNLQGIIPINL